MEIITTHATRMQPGYVCVAGQRVGDNASIRPVLPQGQLPRMCTALEAGPFWPGNRVDLGPASPRPSPPEVEDHVFTLARARLVRSEAADAFWELLRGCARARLSDVFGPELQDVGATAALPEGRGSASLGVLRPRERPSLTRFDDGARVSVKMSVSDGERELSVGVTDIRLYAADHRTLDRDACDALDARLRSQPCLLAVGVSRPWRRPGDDAPRHWLQVNGVHFPSGPSWTS